MGWLPLMLVVEDKPISLHMQGGQLFSGTFARNLISQGKRDTWEKVFLLPKQREVSLEKGEVILHQVIPA